MRKPFTKFDFLHGTFFICKYTILFDRKVLNSVYLNTHFTYIAYLKAAHH